LGVPTTLIEIDSGGNENSQIVILMRIPLLSYLLHFSKTHSPWTALTFGIIPGQEKLVTRITYPKAVWPI